MLTAIIVRQQQVMNLETIFVVSNPRNKIFKDIVRKEQMEFTPFYITFSTPGERKFPLALLQQLSQDRMRKKKR